MVEPKKKKRMKLLQERVVQQSVSEPLYKAKGIRKVFRRFLKKMVDSLRIEPI